MPIKTTELVIKLKNGRHAILGVSLRCQIIASSGLVPSGTNVVAGVSDETHTGSCSAISGERVAAMSAFAACVAFVAFSSAAAIWARSAIRVSALSADLVRSVGDAAARSASAACVAFAVSAIVAVSSARSVIRLTALSADLAKSDIAAESSA